ncbi:unnamed protein product, partial [Ectocarpus sp. 12 AP-2014]
PEFPRYGPQLLWDTCSYVAFGPFYATFGLNKIIFFQLLPARETSNGAHHKPSARQSRISLCPAILCLSQRVPTTPKKPRGRPTKGSSGNFPTTCSTPMSTVRLTNTFSVA